MLERLSCACRDLTCSKLQTKLLSQTLLKPWGALRVPGLWRPKDCHSRHCDHRFPPQPLNAP